MYNRTHTLARKIVDAMQRENMRYIECAERAEIVRHDAEVVTSTRIT